MAATEAVPTLQDSKQPSFDEKTNSFVDEKVEKHDQIETAGGILVDTDNIGEVFDSPRLIDLGEDGKERPITTSSDYAVRLVSLEDDPTLRIFTFRMWFLGIGLSCFGSVLGQIFITVSSLFLQIISFILGKVMEVIIPGPSPTARIQTRDNMFWSFLNHGPFNLKEHVAITIMSSTASASSLAISIFASQDLYYNVEVNAGVGIFTLMASQLLGYGIAGVFRAFLVHPTFAIYPQVMPQVQLYDTLHRSQEAVMQRKRMKFFWTVFVGIFVWEWFPEYIAPTLTGISIFCLADRKSAWVTRIFGGANNNEGLGAFALCFDWAYVGSGGGTIGSLFTPLSTMLSLYAGCAVCMTFRIAFCATFASNTWNAQNFPFLSQLLYYENGTEYDQLAILNADLTLNNTLLAEQGLPWYASSQLLYQISRTMYIGASVTHFFLWYWPTFAGIIKGYWTQECDDPHYQKMKVYKEVSNWWYATIFVVCTALAIGLAYAAKSGLPAWALIIALFFAFFFTPIIGTLNATVGYAPLIQNLMQMLGGALVPGKPVANMYFTLYGENPVTQALLLLQDLKTGQYTKVPPRVTFTVQVVGTIIGAILNFVIMKIVLTNQRSILLEVQGTNIWSGQQIQSYNSVAVAWGALGKPLYATGTRYGFVPYMLLVGLLFPIPFWLLHKKWPKFGWNLIFTPILAELGFLSVGINSSVFSTLLVALFSQYYLRKYYPTWFRKYNFLLSAALDGGTEIMIFVSTFAVNGGSGTAHPFPNWGLNPSSAEGVNLDYCMALNNQ
ncbi:OPT oligopeptide transporter [Gymnopus androsaceus JB14]|uniref:OPT oligopeptide transporter n=1 Tax=Gymnopus androsaceus JB14 TaxID=1447944 RepID=A0A6A4HEX5_9AGAR|nr:OPT oligopeptide transporter [Gymnopus androsaceus JB14]